MVYGMSPIKALFERVQLIERQKKFYSKLFSEGVGTYCECPECEEDLVTQEDNVEVNKEDGTVIFEYSSCEVQSTWDFSAPAPILIDYGTVVVEEGGQNPFMITRTKDKFTQVEYYG